MPKKKIPSDASSPDLDWSQIRETVMMLDLALTQIERSMTDGDDSVNALTELFISLVGNIQVIRMASKKLANNKEKSAITENCMAISKKVNEAIVAFQFYDKLAQRLSHVSFSLSSLGELIAEQSRLYNPYEWKGLQEVIKSKYNIDEDRAMFDAILKGATVEEALQVSEWHKKEMDKSDNVELF